MPPDVSPWTISPRARASWNTPESASPRREGDNRYEGRPFTYLFGVGDGEVVIDGHGMAMFVNHSCDPNCETDEEGDRVYIASIRDIAAGEELPTIIASTTATMTRPVTAAARVAAGACTRPRS